MQKQLIAHKFTTGWEVVKGEQSLKRKPKSKKGGEDDSEMEWWVQCNDAIVTPCKDLILMMPDNASCPITRA